MGREKHHGHLQRSCRVYSNSAEAGCARSRTQRILALLWSRIGQTSRSNGGVSTFGSDGLSLPQVERCVCRLLSPAARQESGITCFSTSGVLGESFDTAPLLPKFL